MVYAEVSDSLLRQDYYQGIAVLDPTSENIPTNRLASSQQDTLRQLVKELKSPGLEPTRRNEILDQMQRLLEYAEQSLVTIPFQIKSTAC